MEENDEDSRGAGGAYQRFNARLPLHLYEAIREAAYDNRRKMNDELVLRLTRSFMPNAADEEVAAAIREAAGVDPEAPLTGEKLGVRGEPSRVVVSRHKADELPVSFKGSFLREGEGPDASVLVRRKVGASTPVSKRLDNMESVVAELQATMKAILEKMPDK